MSPSTLCASILFFAMALSTPALAVGIVVDGPDGFPTEEGKIATFTLRLASKPASDVTLSVTAAPADEITVTALDPGPFKPEDWDKPRTYIIEGVDDEKFDGDQKAAVTVGVVQGPMLWKLMLPFDIETENLDDDTTFNIESNYVTCDGPATEDIHDSSLIGWIYLREKARYRRDAPDFEPDPVQDDLIFSEHSDGTSTHLRTLHVLVRDSYTRSFTDVEIAAMKRNYARGAHKIHDTTRGLLTQDFDQVALELTLDKASFSDVPPPPPNDPSLPKHSVGDGHFHASFDNYGLIVLHLWAANIDVDAYDVISVSIPFQNNAVDLAGVANAVPPDFSQPGFTNPDTWLNDKTWTTLQYVPDPEATGWVDIFVHEVFHNIEWMFEWNGYARLRNPDDAWWKFTYPTEDLLAMHWVRPKTRFAYLPPTWGKLVTKTPEHIFEMTCKDEKNYRERKVRCDEGVTCDLVGCMCAGTGGTITPPFKL